MKTIQTVLTTIKTDRLLHGLKTLKVGYHWTSSEMLLPIVILLFFAVITAGQNTTVCGDSSYYGPSGVIRSPNYPNDYNDSLNCNYNVYASTGNSLLFIFESFETEPNYDVVTISCPTNSNYPPHQFSGDSLPDSVWFPWCSQGLVNFRTDGSVVRSGFSLLYNVTVEVASTCGNGSNYGPSGTISSPNYPDKYVDNLDCYYYIHASSGSSLSLTFKSFDLEEGYDYVTISCPNNSSFPPLTYTGNSLPDAVSIPWCSLGLVNFRTDDSNVYSGFSLNYYVSVGGCGNTVYTGSYGYVTSPNYPNVHGTNLNCSNIIWASERSTFYLYFESFFLFTCCSCDWLEISCIDNSDFGPYKFCGAHGSADIYIHRCSQVLLFFRTDGSNSQYGFKIQYTVYSDSESTTVAVTSPGVTPTTPTPPVTTLEPACKYEHLYGPSGAITTPNYPGDYYNGLQCYYYIYATRGSSVTFIFRDFHVEDSPDYLLIDCPPNSSFPEQRYSGHTLPLPLLVTWCSKASLYFYTDSATVFTGFNIDYYVSDGDCGYTLHIAPTGYVASPNYPSNYSYYQNCSNIIWAPQPSHIHLNFLFFDLYDCGLCPGDWVEVSCLDDDSSIKHRFCGNSSYPVDFYQCSQVLVLFHSDGSNNYQGFNIEYNIYADSEMTTVVGASVTDTVQTSTVSTPEPGCDAVHCGSSGKITSPNYPGNYYDSLDCYNYIYASNRGSITFIFEQLDVQEDKDYVIIRCETNSSFPEQRYSGHALPPALSIPWCSQASLHFHTDTDTVYSGFSIDYYVSDEGCGKTLFTGLAGNVTSPNYPSGYGYYKNCSNIIWAQQPSHFHLNFPYFSLQTCEVCTCDWVEVSCRDNNPSNKYRFCSSTRYPVDFYQCTAVLVWFHSDGYANYQGFDLDYNVYPESGCGDDSYYNSGVIHSPNNPDYYNDSLYCDYNIYTSSPSGSIAIIFQSFNTEECCDYVTISCATNSSYAPMTYSGNSVPQPLSVPWCSQARVNFRSDSSVTFPGFRMDYFVSLGGCGNTMYTEAQKYISSPNYPNNYDNNQNCSNILVASKSTTFNITFLYMNLEECCDFVELSCLDNPDGRRRFTGDSIPPPQTISQCTEVLVWFFSDDSNVYEGFNLEYFIIPESDALNVVSNVRPNEAENMPKIGKHNAEEKVPSNDKSTSGENVPSNGNRNAEENAPSFGKPNSEEKSARIGN